MRLFVGLPLASEVLKELSEAVARLQGPQDGLRWTSPESWHITMQFLGNTDQQHSDCVLARLGEIREKQFRVRLGEFGFFDRAGVFFVDVIENASLSELAWRVNAATSACGFVVETRPFHPHITLARAKGDGRSGALRAIEKLVRREFGERGTANSRIRAIPGPKIGTRGTRNGAGERGGFSNFVAAEFLLYESYTRPDGAEYEIRGRFALRLPE